MISKVDESTTLYYTVCLPKIWNQNVTVSQILVMFMLNFISFYFQSTLLVLFPNVLLLMIYILINNISIHKGYSQDFMKALESPTDFLHCSTKLNTKVMPLTDNEYTNIYFPHKFISEFKFKDELCNSSFLQNKSNFEREISTAVPVKCNIVTTTSSTSVTASSTTAYCIVSQNIAPTTTTSTFSSKSPICSSIGMFSDLSCTVSCSAPVSINNLPSTSSISIISPSQTTCENLQDFAELENVKATKSATLCPDFLISNKVSSREIECSDFEVSNKNTKFSNMSDQKQELVSNIKDMNTNINIENNKSSLSQLELKSMLEVLPRFEGDLKDYKFFKEKFKILTEHQGINFHDKAFLLYSSLDDKVLNLLRPVTINGLIDFQLLWDNLDLEYSLPENGSLYYSNALFSLGSWPLCNTLESLNKLHKFILINHLGLEREGVQESGVIYGMKILSLLEGDLALNVASLLSSDLCKTAILPEILQLLKQEIRYLQINKLAQATKNGIHVKFENIENENGEISHSEKDHFENQQNLVKDVCVFCKSMDHLSIHCNLYSRPRDYYSSLFEQFRCFNCFQKGHKSFSCSLSKLCNLCNDPRPHSPIICNNNRSKFP